jgi:hypothetical protein
VGLRSAWTPSALRAEIEASVLPLATSVDRHGGDRHRRGRVQLVPGVVGAILALPFAPVIKIVLREAGAPRRARMAALRDP